MDGSAKRRPRCLEDGLRERWVDVDRRRQVVQRSAQSDGQRCFRDKVARVWPDDVRTEQLARLSMSDQLDESGAVAARKRAANSCDREPPHVDRDTALG